MATPLKQPLTLEDKIWGLYYFVDASLGEPLSITSVVGMLAGATIDPICQRQHCASSESHTAEVVAGGSGLHRLVYAREIMREWYYGPSEPTPMAFDSATTIFVANDEKAAKRTVWLRRRANVLSEGVAMGDFEPVKVDESLNVADMHTKYLVFNVWRRHLWWAHNLTPERCAKARARMQAARDEFKGKNGA